ncbi:MAG: hypothetical protein U0K91_02290 [Acutalibacteraceae bacterium]|nr:hypothetical protein [Acutalibacteraceae bacterium]
MSELKFMKCRCGGTVFVSFNFSCAGKPKASMRCDKCGKVAIKIGTDGNLMEIWEKAEMPKKEVFVNVEGKSSICKDCLMYEKCCDEAYRQAYYEGKVDKILIFLTNRVPCKFFKNKADYTKVRHGEWIETYNEMVCSKCHLPPLTKEVTNGTIEILTKYCPNCGAKMDGKGD